MLTLDKGIVSGKSIAGIQLGSEVAEVLREIAASHLQYSKRTFSNFGHVFQQFDICDSGLSFTADETQRIVRVSCRKPYDGRYKGKLRAGLTVTQLLQYSSRRTVIHGFIVVDGDFGVAFGYPESYEGHQYDDVDSIQELPPEMVLEEIHVMNPEWWH